MQSKNSKLACDSLNNWAKDIESEIKKDHFCHLTHIKTVNIHEDVFSMEFKLETNLNSKIVKTIINEKSLKYKDFSRFFFIYDKPKLRLILFIFVNSDNQEE